MSWLDDLSDTELRQRLERRGWSDVDAAIAARQRHQPEWRTLILAALRDEDAA